MTARTVTRIGLGIGAMLVAAIVVGMSHQNISAQGPGPGGPGGGRFGGPGGGFGGPGGGPDGGGPGGRRGGPGGPGGPGALGPMMLERLDLTSDQRDRVRQILDSHRDDERAIGDRAMKAHEALDDVMSGTFDESAIRARAADVAAVEADVAVAQGRIYSEVFQILTADQQTKLKKLQSDMKERRAKMQQQRQDRGANRGQK